MCVLVNYHTTHKKNYTLIQNADDLEYTARK